jgi:hypothetical protein
MQTQRERIIAYLREHLEGANDGQHQTVKGKSASTAARGGTNWDMASCLRIAAQTPLSYRRTPLFTALNKPWHGDSRLLTNATQCYTH